MAHTIEFKVTATIDRTSGLFASRDDIAEAMRQEIEDGNPGSLYGLGNNGDSEYEITDFEVEVV